MDKFIVLALFFQYTGTNDRFTLLIGYNTIYRFLLFHSFYFGSRPQCGEDHQ